MKRIVPRGTEKCIFCRGEPTNYEHVYPRWTHRYIHKEKGKYHSLLEVHTLNGKPPKRVKGKGRGDIHDWQVKCVDERCNNGWMRELENRAIPILTPMIRGETQALLIQSQRIISGWATLKAVVGEYELPDMTTWDRTARERLKRVKLPPKDHCKIWVGYYPRAKLYGDWSYAPFSYLRGKINRERLGEPASNYNGATTTQVLGNLIIHTIHAPSRRVLKAFRFTPVVERKLRIIWPPFGKQIIWPPDALNERETSHVAWAFIDQLMARADRAMARLKGRKRL